MPNAEFVSLKVYNILGQEVRTLVNERKEAGRYRFAFDAEGLTSGVYVYRIQAAHDKVGVVASKKMLYIK